MADNTASLRKESTGDSSHDGASHVPREEYHQPAGFKGLYHSTTTQIALLGFVCFMCPGLFNALNGLGGGGQVTATTSANANVALYSTFAFFAFFAGSINNVLGSKLTLLLGSLGYALYIGSYLAINIHPGAGAFVITAGAILGICAGLLWTAQGSLMLAYPTENQKGKFIAIFWSIFNLGGVVGASVSLGQNFNSEILHVEANSVGNGTYIGFLVLTLIGVVIPLLMIDPTKMVRSDGTRVIISHRPSWKTEFYSLYIALVTDPWIVLLFPMFFASNWFYTWQFNDFNGAIFNIRARSLNNLLYWSSQIIGSILIGILLDNTRLSRRLRAFAGWSVLVIMVFVVHTWAYFYQKEYTREQVTAPDYHKIDVFDRAYIGRAFLYVACGLLDSMWQTASYWLMGAMSNNPAKLAHFAGFYKSLQSAGAAGVWRADAVGLPFMNIFISTWALLVGGLVFALPMIHMRVKDHTDEAQDELYDADRAHAEHHDVEK
ncbi:MFS general substrate transporter [Trametopsis cervina]|nr:MFS general substrate transporter [Trametopsis cervina]